MEQSLAMKGENALEETIRRIVREEIAAHKERMIQETKESFNQDCRNFLDALGLIDDTGCGTP